MDTELLKTKALIQYVSLTTLILLFPQLYVNSEKVGHAVFPLNRPGSDLTAGEKGHWEEAPLLDPYEQHWPEEQAVQTPVIMVGCHRHSFDSGFRGFMSKRTALDELAIWTRFLVVNRTHDETLYFTGGYSELLI